MVYGEKISQQKVEDVMKLKEELKMKLKELRNVDNEYEGRLRPL